MPKEIAFAQVLQQLMDEKYRRNRAELAAVAHVSPSALSQYVRGRATPSLDVLVSLADALGVSLEYLVFGREQVTPPPELGYLPYLEAHMRTIEAQGASLHDLVARIGTRIANSVLDAAQELLPGASGMAGVLNVDDVAKLERCSSHTIITTTDLSLEVLVLKHEGGTDVAAPSVFAQVVAENIKEGSRYTYLVPHGPDWSRSVRLFRQEVTRLSGIDTPLLDRLLQVFYVNRACVPGHVIQHFAIEQLKGQAPPIYERVSRFIFPDPDNSSMGYLSYTEMLSASNQHFDLIAQDNTQRLLEEILATLRPEHRTHSSQPKRS